MIRCAKGVTRGDKLYETLVAPARPLIPAGSNVAMVRGRRAAQSRLRDVARRRSRAALLD